MLHPTTLGKALTLAIATVVITAASSQAADFTWTNGDAGNSNINDPDNWSSTPDTLVPATGDHVIFGNAALGNPAWNSNIGVTMDLDDGGWDFNITSRLYTRGLLDYGTAGLGLTSLGGAGRLGVSATSEWRIGTGNTLLVTAGILELNQSLVKSGAGTLVLAASSASGNRGIEVAGGTVLVNMTSVQAVNSDWSVSAGATLGGTGRVRSNRAGGIVVSGALAPGGNGTWGALTGALEIELGASDRFLTMAPGSSLKIDLGTAGEVDLLRITDGILDLSAGGDTLSITATDAPANGAYTLATYGARSGTFATITYNGTPLAELDGLTLTYGTSALTLTVDFLPPPTLITVR